MNLEQDMEMGRGLVACVKRHLPSLNRSWLPKVRKRTRRLVVESYEARRLLDATPYSTMQLLRSANDPLSEAITVRLDTYQFSINTNTNVARDTIGLPEFDVLRVVANQQENSPVVFAVIDQADRFPKAVLTQFDAGGNAVSAWVLANVFLTEQSIRNDGAATLEVLNFQFDQITEASSQLTSSWDKVANRPQGPAFLPRYSLHPMQALLVQLSFNSLRDQAMPHRRWYSN